MRIVIMKEGGGGREGEMLKENMFLGMGFWNMKLDFTILSLILIISESLLSQLARCSE